MRIITHTPDETAELGRRLGEACRGGEVILLEGALGAGKTTLTQGMAAGLGVSVPVVSPTFVLLREYQGRLPLYHFDFYRLEDGDHAADLQFEDYLETDGVAVIEWPSYAAEVIPETYLRVALRDIGDDRREVVLEPVGARYEALVQPLRLKSHGKPRALKCLDGSHKPSRYFSERVLAAGPGLDVPQSGGERHEGSGTPSGAMDPGTTR